MNIQSIVFFLKRFPTGKASRELNRLNKLSADELKHHAENKCWEMVKHHYAHTAYYKAKLGEHIPENWNELPVLTKKDFQGSIENLLSGGFTPDNSYIGNTSGSSGHPFYFAKDKFTHALTWAYIHDCYKMHDIHPGDLQARFYGIPLEKKKYFIEQAKDYILNRERFTVFDLSDQVLDEFINRFKQKPFKYIYGYTNSIVLFCRYLLKMNIRLKDVCPSLKVCIVTSEVCTPEDKILIEKATGIPVVKEYGASELCLIAFEHPDGLWRINTKTIFVEQTDDGKLLCTSLYNKAFPMIRYEIGDMGQIDYDKNGYPYLSALLGRTNDTIVLPSGKVSPGLTFYYISRSILESKGILKEFIIRQTAIDTFIFDIVCDGELDADVAIEITQKAEMYLEKGLHIILNKTYEIKRPASGKIKHFYSEIK
jgi:phenylacetate-CoA ligase